MTELLGLYFNWRPISIAPPSGIVVELLSENGKLDTGYWCEWSESFDKQANGIADAVTGEFSTEHGYDNYTHWRPLD